MQNYKQNKQKGEGMTTDICYIKIYVYINLFIFYEVWWSNNTIKLDYLFYFRTMFGTKY